MFHRRTFLQTVSRLPLVGALIPAAAPAAETRDYFKDLGVRTFINAAGTYTALTASLMPREVMEAMNYASRYYVSLNELQEAVGARIASLRRSASRASNCPVMPGFKCFRQPASEVSFSYGVR